MYTDHHAKYYAHALTRRSSSDDPDKLGASLMNATVDLNPHQIDAAMFAFRSPLSRGAILADEVGLGKTIEAGLIISQLWAERKRRILIIVPTTLRSQWVQELADKFFLKAEVFESRKFNIALKAGSVNPFLDTSKIIVCSYNFARSAELSISAISWDLVVIDEAHRLRNVLKSGNKIARAIKGAIQNARGKILLTATPLQNTLLELYALAGFLDEHLFGDLESFKAQYLRGALGRAEYNELRQRIRPICQRTLRRQVTEYVRYTNRVPMVHDFTPSNAEQKLYEDVSEYLRRDEILALPKSQRKLMILVLRKLLASSTFAIAGTLESLRLRLQSQYDRSIVPDAAVGNDYESFDELKDEWAEEVSAPEVSETSEGEADGQALQAEIQDLVRFRDLATSITENAKGEKLLQALRLGFQKLHELGANQKAVIFTESRRTQQYLWDLLNANGYAGQVMTFNGTNTDPASATIYQAWRKRHEGEPALTGTKDGDMRAALIEHFHEGAAIMIATEAAAEGVNLQFCSLVVNYDLPWNPQRIEQRIGRCHRYGQKHDVVVINFINRGNEADQRVFEILSDKFRLFDGVFGASDEVLGALESGVDFERRIAGIYQSCRTSGEIDQAFKDLQAELGEEIQNRMTTTRANLLEHFDEEVHQRLRLRLKDMGERLDRYERWLWQLTRHELRGQAQFDDDAHRFVVSEQIDGTHVPFGSYGLVTRERTTDNVTPYRLGSELAQNLIAQCRRRQLLPASIRFRYSSQGPGRKISDVERLVGRRGWLLLTEVAVESEEQQEDYLMFAGVSDDGAILDAEACEKLLDVPGELMGSTSIPEDIGTRLARIHATNLAEKIANLAERNTQFFDEEIDKLDRWAEDRKRSVELELKNLKTEIATLKKAARLQASLEEKVALQRKVKEMETQLTRKRRELFEAEDDIDRQKEVLIATVENRLKQRTSSEQLFLIEWEVA
jgi:superfamily II DNA or RNA helicase